MSAVRSREWKQLWVHDDAVADACNRLDAAGWSVHSILYTGAKAQGIDGAAVLVLSWRAIGSTPAEPPKPTTPFR